MLIPDALAKFKIPYNGINYTCFVLLEIDYTHYTSENKILTFYPKLYREQVLKEYCGAAEFPFIVIARPTPGIRIQPREIEVIYTDLKFNNLLRLMLD